MRRPLTALTVTAAVALTGCGNRRAAVPDTATAGPPLGTNAAGYPQAGLRFGAPAGWHVEPGHSPLVTTITTGRAAIAVWRYPRTEPLPATTRALEQAKSALLAAAKARDATFAPQDARATRVDGRGAVEVRGTETVEGARRAVRSTHVFAFGAELVVDASAPPRDFARVDRQVFGPLLRSLRVSRPRASR
jgi:hypothetical protein